MSPQDSGGLEPQSSLVARLAGRSGLEGSFAPGPAGAISRAHAASSGADGPRPVPNQGGRRSGARRRVLLSSSAPSSSGSYGLATARPTPRDWQIGLNYHARHPRVKALAPAARAPLSGVDRDALVVNPERSRLARVDQATRGAPHLGPVGGELERGAHLAALHRGQVRLGAVAAARAHRGAVAKVRARGTRPEVVADSAAQGLQRLRPCARGANEPVFGIGRRRAPPPPRL